MSVTAYQWSRVLHIVAFTMWVGGMFTLIQLLAAHARSEAGARAGLESIERITGIIMDAGATLAILVGFYITIRLDWIHFKGGGYMHVKLTLVVVLLGLHGFLRVKIRKFREGQVAPLPGFLTPALGLLFFGIVAMIVAKPM